MAHAFHRISNMLKRKEKMRILLTGVDSADKKEIYTKLNSNDAAISTPVASENVKLVMIGLNGPSSSPSSSSSSSTTTTTTATTTTADFVRLAKDGQSRLVDKPIRYEDYKGLIFLVDCSSKSSLVSTSGAPALRTLLETHHLDRLPLLIYGLLPRGQKREVTPEVIVDKLNLASYPSLVYQVFLINWDSISFFYDGISWLIYRIQNPDIDQQHHQQQQQRHQQRQQQPPQ